MIIGIAGPTAGGKTTLATALGRYYYAYRTRYSEILAAHARAEGLPTDKATLQQLYIEGREKKGEGFLANLMKLRLQSVTADLIVIEGNRRMVDLALMQEIAEERDEELKLIFIDASVETRFARYNVREAAIGRDNFMKLENNPAEDELPKLREAISEMGCVIDTDALDASEMMLQAFAYLDLNNRSAAPTNKSQGLSSEAAGT